MICLFRLVRLSESGYRLAIEGFPVHRPAVRRQLVTSTHGLISRGPDELIVLPYNVVPSRHSHAHILRIY